MDAAGVEVAVLLDHFEAFVDDTLGQLTGRPRTTMVDRPVRQSGNPTTASLHKEPWVDAECIAAKAAWKRVCWA